MCSFCVIRKGRMRKAQTMLFWEIDHDRRMSEKCKREETTDT